MDVIFTSTSTISTGKEHLKNPCKKLHLGCRMHAIWKNSEVYFENIHFLNFVYMASCMPAAKVNHVIPCFSIRWKSKGSLFINHLTLNLSWSLIITILGKSILLPLKVTVISFQSISNVSHR